MCLGWVEQEEEEVKRKLLKLSNHVGHVVRDWKMCAHIAIIQFSNFIFVFSLNREQLQLTFRLDRSRRRHLFSLWWLFTFSLTLKKQHRHEREKLVASIIPKKWPSECSRRRNHEIEIYFQPHLARSEDSRGDFNQLDRLKIGAMIIEKLFFPTSSTRRDTPLSVNSNIVRRKVTIDKRLMGLSSLYDL